MVFITLLGERCQSERVWVFLYFRFQCFNTMAGHNVNASIVRYTQDTNTPIVRGLYNET